MMSAKVFWSNSASVTRAQELGIELIIYTLSHVAYVHFLIVGLSPHSIEGSEVALDIGLILVLY